MFNLAGILAVALTSERFDGAALRRIAICAAAAIVAVPLAYAIIVASGPSRAGGPLRVSWPQAEISKRFSAVWARETGRPLRIVTGDNWVAGLVGVSGERPPLDPQQRRSGLLPLDHARADAAAGMLIVWDASTKRIPPSLQPLVSAAPPREERFKWRRSRDRGDLAIGYAIVPPK